MHAYVGGYTTPDRDGRGDGIHVYRIDPASEAWTHLQHISGLENPSLFTLRSDSRVLYSVHGGRTLVSAFAVDAPSGHLRLLNQMECGGTNPVDSALDPTERFLVVANYGSGNVAVLNVAADGALQEVAQIFPLPGKTGPHPTQQDASRPHAVIFDPSGRFVIVPDKGFDCVFIFCFDAAAGRIALNQSMMSRPGAAPRHCVFHPTMPVLYVNNELDSTVAVYRWDTSQGKIEVVQVIATVPPEFLARNTTAEIGASRDGRFLYVSNRGQDSIATFSVAAESGQLRFLGCTPSGGRRPRFFTLDASGRFLFAANQDSDNVVAFRVDAASGSLTRSGQEISVGSPSAISLVP
jgi:6-phosphogluconolactonase (cycloisomerase 2 family)